MTELSDKQKALDAANEEEGKKIADAAAAAEAAVSAAEKAKNLQTLFDNLDSAQAGYEAALQKGNETELAVETAKAKRDAAFEALKEAVAKDEEAKAKLSEAMSLSYDGLHSAPVTNPRYEYLNRFRDKIRALEALMMALPERPKAVGTSFTTVSHSSNNASFAAGEQVDYFSSMLKSFLRGAGIPSGKIADLFKNTPVMASVQNVKNDYSLMSIGAAQKILMAKKNGAVYLIASPYDTLTKDVVNAIKARPDVSIVVKYTGTDGKVRIAFSHANKDISGFINKQGGLDLNKMRSITAEDAAAETF